MFDALAVVALVFAAHMKWLGEQPACWLRARLADWRGRLRGKGALAGWIVCAVLPALVAGSVDALISNGFLQFVYSFAVLTCCMALPGYLSRSAQVTDAVYNGDRDLAQKTAVAWGPGPDQDEMRFAERMLSFCAVRLHGDVLAVLFWFVLLGPGGAVLYVGHAVLAAAGGGLGPAGRVLEKPAQWASVLLLALVGNFSPALAHLSAADPGRAALAAAGMHGESIDVEQVPQYRLLLNRTLLLGAAMSLLLLFLGLVR